MLASKTKDAKQRRKQGYAVSRDVPAKLSFEDRRHLPWCSARFQGCKLWYTGVILAANEKNGEVFYDVEYDTPSEQESGVWLKDIELNIPASRMNFITLRAK